MGPTSMWSFVRRLLVKVDQVFPRPTETPRDPFYSDGVAMKLVWDPIRRDEKPNLADIPFYDFATYLFHTAKFRLGNLGLLIDQPTFLMRLAEFAEEPERVAQEHRLWLAEYFLVMAFGEAFIARNAKRSTQTLAGSDFASRALSLIPSSDQLHENGLLSIEVLALAALYLHCIDMRASAIQYVSVAQVSQPGFQGPAPANNPRSAKPSAWPLSRASTASCRPTFSASRCVAGAATCGGPCTLSTGG